MKIFIRSLVVAVVLGIVGAALVWGMFHSSQIRKARQVASGPPCIPFVTCRY